jgi:hypothetical protein
MKLNRRDIGRIVYPLTACESRSVRLLVWGVQAVCYLLLVVWLAAGCLWFLGGCITIQGDLVLYKREAPASDNASAADEVRDAFGVDDDVSTTAEN